MPLRNLKSVRGMQKIKNKFLWLVERLKFEFSGASVQKPSHGMKPNLVHESYTY